MNHVVLLSGGLDSAVLLAHVRATEPGGVLALSFDYGQRHRRELDSAAAVAAHCGVPHEVRALPPELFAGSSLTGGGGEVAGAATVVPGRNAVLLAAAVATAVRAGARWVWFAPHAGDADVYPDCRGEFVSAFDAAARAGYGVGVFAPFLAWPKARVVDRGRQLGVPFELTWSCYAGGAEPCGACGACVGRKAALA